MGRFSNTNSFIYEWLVLASAGSDTAAVSSPVDEDL